MSSLLSLAPYGLLRPQKVEWLVPELPAEPLDIITSKTTKKFLKNHLQNFITENHLTIDSFQITREKYLAWIPEYEAIMKKNKYSIFATADWFDTKTQIENRTIHAIFVHQNATLIGSAIISETQSGKFTLHFKASEKLESHSIRNSSLGSAIEFFFLEFCYTHKAVSISSGISRNAFGMINSFGYLNFKTRYGYAAHTVENVPSEPTVEYDPQRPICFFAHTSTSTENRLPAYLFYSQETPPDVLECLRYVPYQVLTPQHNGGN